LAEKAMLNVTHITIDENAKVQAQIVSAAETENRSLNQAGAQSELLPGGRENDGRLIFGQPGAAAHRECKRQWSTQ
jgi:hypothetical protein